MSIGNFKETNESNEVNEVRENTDNTEKSRNQILETPESYDDDFDSRLDSNEQKNESKKEEQDGGEESGGEQISLFDRMKNLFLKKESSEEAETSGDDRKEADTESSTEKSSGFIDALRKDAPSLEEQAEQIKNIPGREDYLDAREKTEQAKKDYPDMKDWELSPEQLSEVRQGQSEIAKESPDERAEEGNEATAEGRSPGGDAWERRFGHLEEND